MSEPAATMQSITTVWYAVQTYARHEKRVADRMRQQGPAALGAVTELWLAAGADVSTLAAGEHDRIMAAVSHLPHVAAYSLAAVIGAQPGVAGLTGGGFADTTRVAGTPPAMWVDIMLENREALLPLVDALGERVAALRAAIAYGDAEALAALLAEGRAARARVLA